MYGLSDWQASGRISEFLTRYTENENKLHKAESGLKRWNHMRDAALHVVVGIVVISMLVWTGNQVGGGQFSATIIAAFVLMTLSITDSLVPVSEAIESLPAYEDSLKRVSETEENSGQENAGNKNQLAGKENQTGVELEDVSFRYPNSENWVLQNVSLSISPGKKIAILGRSGTGKSTLLKLVTGALKPENGKIFINGMEANRSLLSDSISVLNQKPHLFDTTVGNNLRIGRPEASDEEVWSALESAQIAPLIASLPKGLDTPMHEMGKRFSGGERQRIAFARVLLQNTPIIILDEPTIGLDPATENALLETMFRAAKEKTIILVTHHLAQVERMDEVIFLENGGIAMKGSHGQLLKSNEKYQKLYAMDRGI